MIVKDEEENLSNCLQSIEGLVDEIIIVDTGSSDRTKDIASTYTDKVLDYVWTDDFAAARNYSFSLATKDYILWLDADDVILEPEREKFKHLKQSLPAEIDAVDMQYVLSVDAAGMPSVSTRRYRLVRRSKGYCWKEPIHEYLDISSGTALAVNIAISHSRKDNHAKRNLELIEKWVNAGGKLESRMLYNYASELMDLHRYSEASEGFEQYLGEKENNRDDLLMACAKLADCYSMLGRADERLEALLRSFRYDAPHAEFCCNLGSCFEEKGDWITAAYWYQQALFTAQAQRPLPIENKALSTWMPHCRLCVCYARLGNIVKAHEHNEAALTFLPQDKKLLDNKEQLNQIISRMQKE